VAHHLKPLYLNFVVVYPNACFLLRNGDLNFWGIDPFKIRE
jgi:hypothetical protein